MSLIQNLVARLTMDSTAFDRNAKGASGSMRGMMSASLALQRSVVGLGGAYLGARGLTSAIASVTKAGIAAESADRGMIAALKVRGQYSEQNAQALRDQADRMQDLTVYSRNAIKEQSSLALTMGASVPEIESMTTAAIGLASAYKKDLSTAMRIIALARQGETGQLKEMGIVVDRTKSKHQQYLQILDAGTKNFQRAKDDTATLGGAVEQLRNEWERTKEAMAKPLTPALTSAMKFVQKELKGGQGGQSAFYRVKALPKEQQSSLWKAYAQRTKETGVKEDFGYLSKLTSAYERSGRVKTPGTDGASAAAGVSAAQREQIVKLNEQLKEQIAIQREVNAGNLHAAETARYAAEAEEVYGKGTKEAEGAIIKYNSALQALDDLRSRKAAGDYLKDLQDQEQILQLQRAGLDDQARLQEVLNDFRRQGIELTQEETDAIAEQIDRVSDLEDHYQSLGDGIQSAFAEIRDEMQTAGDLAHDVVKVGFEGVADSIADAAVEGENLSDSIRNVDQEIAKMLVKWAAMQAMNMILPGSGSITSLVGHDGGVIGSGGFASRRDSPMHYLGVPRLHDGLKPDEFRFIGQRGEKITSKSGVASENKLLSRIASLLERRQSVNLSASIVDRRDVVTRERLESREGEQMVMYHVGRNQ